MITASELETNLAAIPRASPALVLDGVLARAGEPGDDDAWLAPVLGLAVVARGLGAIGDQGRPAAKLAVWSLVGELAFHAEASLEERVRQGLARADAAVERLSSNWPVGLVRPCATLAAVLLDGSDALVAHVGDCSVARIEGDRLVPLTVPHVLAAEHPEAPPQLARALTRTLGSGREPALQRIPVQPGDVLLLSTAPWPDELALGDLAPDTIATALVHRGATTVIVVRVDEHATRASDRGSSRPPALPWLFAPGQPLAEPPERYAPGTPGHGPDASWFSAVFDGVMR